MKTKMGILLIVIGVILTVVGVVMVSGNEKSEENIVMLPSRPENEDASSSDVAVPKVEENSSDTLSHPTLVKHEDNTSEQKKPKTSKEKGDEFEDFTVNLLADWRMKLLRRTQDKMSSGGVVAESCKEPDLHIE